ncbi:class I SAM-dependent methyltransferase [Atopomonas sediminilitoris]|uniref:class I SAM-dependent methyltransferase n=1 Tax=Atopomonas sediminilitoris TaxID=2919919 RepID=UPI001F4DFF54|nr:class I SAM-dependent methyltransferase [Atopomonas sediminilitoris]MCJ8169992.1 class I SAM-dependent methyltransferase [Atopomonas sediminilitoris]
MDPRSQVLLRQRERFIDQDLLLAGLPADDLLAELPQAHGWSWHAGEAAVLKQRFDQRCHFASTLSDTPYHSAVLFLPKAREQVDYLLQTIAARLNSGANLYLVGEKRTGIERAAKQLQNLGRAIKLDSARHCQLWHVELSQPISAPRDPWQQWSLSNPPHTLAIHSLPGVFSHGRLDKGSALLLEHLADLPGHAWLDYGCGAGVIGASLKQRHPAATLQLLDVDAFAVASSQRTLEANQLDAQVIAADSLAGFANASLDAVISNPPFHQGVDTQYQVSHDLIREAHRVLRPGGELRIVANDFLRYPPLIEQHFAHCETLAHANGFRIYRAIRR